MELTRQEYPALLTSLEPSQAVTVLNDRVKLIGKVNSDIADWLLERRRVEEVYVQGLKRLASRRQDTVGGLGVFQTPWHGIISSTEALADSHSILAQKIESDVERPLRDFSSKSREMQGMSTIQGNLAAMAKELEEAQRKAEKLRSKVGKADNSKLSSAKATHQNANQQWESQAPFVFEQLQALDEGRVNHLRDVLTQLQTHEVDQLERSRASAESALNALLNVATIDEISAFVARTSVTGLIVRPRRDSRPVTGSTSSTSPVPPTPAPMDRASTAFSPASLAIPTSWPIRNLDDSRSEVSAGSANAPMPPPVKARKGGMSGLKRFGTVMRRKTEPKLELMPSPEKRSKPSRNPLKRGSSSRNMQELSSANASTNDLAITPSRQSVTAEGDSSRNPQILQPSQAPAEKRHAQIDTHGNDTDFERTQLPGLTNGAASNSNDQEDSLRRARPPSTIAEEAERDGDGYSMPPIRRDEISRAQDEAAAAESERQFKLDIRNEPIREEDVEAQTALSNVAHTLRTQAQALPPQRKLGTVRGRRDVRNTIFVPNPSSVEGQPILESGIGSMSPLNYARGPLLHSEEPQGNDSQSIRSSHSLSSLAQTGVRHPDMHEPGLNTSIVETVSAWLTNGQVTKAVVIGELALAHHGADISPKTGHIRLENFAVLEKVAPNPTFITQLPNRSGEYTVDLSHLTRTAVAFKYQVHLEEANLARHAPVILTPVWKVEPTQTSVMLSYHYNPAFDSANRSVALHKVVVIINIENARAVACRSKPAGQFSKEKNLIYWKLGDVNLVEDTGVPQRLLARFATETEAKAGSVEVRWEISGEHAVGAGSGLSLSQMGGSREGVDPFADEGVAGGGTSVYKEVVATRKVISGKYVAN